MSPASRSRWRPLGLASMLVFSIGVLVLFLVAGALTVGHLLEGLFREGAR